MQKSQSLIFLKLLFVLVQPWMVENMGILRIFRGVSPKHILPLYPCECIISKSCWWLNFNISSAPRRLGPGVIWNFFTLKPLLCAFSSRAFYEIPFSPMLAMVGSKPILICSAIRLRRTISAPYSINHRNRWCGESWWVFWVDRIYGILWIFFFLPFRAKRRKLNPPSSKKLLFWSFTQHYPFLGAHTTCFCRNINLTNAWVEAKFKSAK